MARDAYIDIHAHYFPDPFLDLIAQEGERCGARLDRSDPRGPAIEVGAHRSAPLRAAFTDLDVRLKEMAQQGVQVHALSLSPPMVYWADAELGLKLARAMNDGLAQAHVAFPDRFVGLAALPMQEPRVALQELERAAPLPGIRGVYMGTNIQGRDLSDPEFFPVYERMEALRLPLFLHPPPGVIGAERLTQYYLRNLLGNPFESAVAAANLIFGGVLDRFKRLQICLPHAGGAFPYLVGRLSHGWKVRPECQHLERPPSAYLRRFRYDTISHSPEALRYLIGLVGADRVMLGSDYCYDMGYDRPVEVITRLRGLSKEGRSRILHGNAARILHIA